MIHAVHHFCMSLNFSNVGVSGETGGRRSGNVMKTPTQGLLVRVYVCTCLSFFFFQEIYSWWHFAVADTFHVKTAPPVSLIFQRNLFFPSCCGLYSDTVCRFIQNISELNRCVVKVEESHCHFVPRTKPNPFKTKETRSVKRHCDRARVCSHRSADISKEA